MSDDVSSGVRTAHRLCRTMLLALLTCLAPATATACSKPRYHTLVQPNDAFLLGRAGTDTVIAGAGPVDYRFAWAQLWPFGNRKIYGQVFDVERIAGPAKARIPKGVKRVVIVPWGYGTDCVPMRYSRCARWAERGMRGMYAAVLRPSSDWVGGIPTLDAFSPDFEPYPARSRKSVSATQARPDSALSIEDMMELMDRLPEVGAMHHDPVAATTPLYAWVRADASRRRAYPVDEVARSVRFTETSTALRAFHHPAVGTFRLTLEVSGHAPETIFVRTEATPGSGMRSRSMPSPPDPTLVPPWDLHTYLMFIARSAWALPEGCGAYYLPYEQGYMTLPAMSGGATSTSGRYPLWIELDAFARAFPKDSALQSIARLQGEAYSDRVTRGTPTLMPGTIELSPRGTTRVSQAETLPDGRRVTVSGERLSEQTIHCDRGF